ncbi:MAG: hypothetical protein JWO46_1562 [Nocardioidaceae bacterium]|nr:hypothetical protein [Nocardioidaceae bacterium]
MPTSSRPADPAGHRGRRPLTRADLPAELTPETLKNLGFGTLRQLARPGNGVLDAEEQRQFDAAFREVMQGTASRVNESLQRVRRGEPGNLDPAMRRSYERMQQRLAEQAGRVRESFPELALDVPPDTDETPTTTEETHEDDVSPGDLEQEVEQTSETLDMLERIASLQQQQLEHQESQLLSETRGFFFAFLVSVAVIIAGVAPLVEAEPHDRLLIVLWTVAAVAVAAIAYAVVRAVQGKK